MYRNQNKIAMKKHDISTIAALLATAALIITLGSLMAGAEGLATVSGFIFVAASAATTLAETARVNKRAK